MSLIADGRLRAGRHVQRQPARDGRRPGRCSPRCSPPRRTRTSTGCGTGWRSASRRCIDRHELPWRVVTAGAKGCVSFLPEPIRNFRDFLRLDGRYGHAHWLVQHNRGRLPAALGQGRAVADVGAAHRRGRRPVRRQLRPPRHPADRRGGLRPVTTHPGAGRADPASGQAELPGARSRAQARWARGAVDDRVLEGDLHDQPVEKGRPHDVNASTSTGPISPSSIPACTTRATGRATAGPGRPGPS